MAYITTEDVKAIRVALKEEFGKDFKFSVTRTSVVCVLPSRPCVANFYDGELDRTDKYNGRVSKFDGYEQINHYHPHFYGAYEKLFKRITEIAHTASCAAGGWAYYCNDDAMSDYFDLLLCKHLVGKWDKPELNLVICSTLKIAA